MATDMTMERLSGMRGAPVYDSAGDEIGTVEEIYYDTDTNAPEWIGLGTGALGTKRVLVPVQGADMRDNGVAVAYSKEQVIGAPDIDSDEITYEQEDELYEYYSLARGTTTDTTVETRDTDADVVRSEEELRVGKREVEAGSVRLRKWVETEPVETQVELRQETARVEREPIDQPVSGADLGEQEIEVPLRGEEAVTEKQAVARERVSVEKGVETETETVRDELRKEQVEVEGDEVDRR